MQHWLFMFRPDTYQQVRQNGVLGVRHSARRRFGSVRKGDRFVAYISRVQQLDGYGEITSDPFEDDTLIFAEDQVYRHRCRVRFDRDGAAVPVGDALWGLEQFRQLATTTPTNMIFCKGGFIEITPADYAVLTLLVDGT